MYTLHKAVCSRVICKPIPTLQHFTMEGFFEEARKEMFTCYGEFPEVVQETCQVLEKLGCSEKKLISKCVPQRANVIVAVAHAPTALTALMYVTRFDDKWTSKLNSNTQQYIKLHTCARLKHMSSTLESSLA